MPPKPTRSKFIFENTIEAARANMKLIKEHDFNINNIFQSEPDSTIQPKFEFRDRGMVWQLFDLSTDSENSNISASAVSLTPFGTALIKVSLLTAYYFSSRPFAQKMVHSGVTENTPFEHFPVCYNQLRYTKSCQFYCR